MSETYTALYTPVEVELDGKKYLLRKKNRAFFRQLAELDAREEKGKAEKTFDPVGSAYDHLKLYVEAPPEVIDDLEAKVVMELSAFVVKNMPQEKKAESEEEIVEKNGSQPGESKPA